MHTDKEQKRKLLFYPCKEEKSTPLPLFSSSVEAGFPSPADDYLEKSLDLNELIVDHPAATFFVRVQGNSMEGANIYAGDILVVDRSIEAKSGQVVVAHLDGEFTLKRISIEEKKIFLLPENPDFPVIEVDQEREFAIWGVVTFVIHRAV